MVRFLFKLFLGLLSIVGVLITLYVVYTIQYAKEKPKWIFDLTQKTKIEAENLSLKRKTYIQKIKACMEQGSQCEDDHCEKNVYDLFFRCIGVKEDKRKVIPVEYEFTN